MKNHKTAVRQASSIVAEQNSPPRAHISKVYGDKTDFGHDKKLKRRRKGPLIGKTILTRQMRNIDPILHQQESFSEVRETFRRIKDIK